VAGGAHAACGRLRAVLALFSSSAATAVKFVAAPVEFSLIDTHYTLWFTLIAETPQHPLPLPTAIPPNMPKRKAEPEPQPPEDEQDDGVEDGVEDDVAEGESQSEEGSSGSDGSSPEVSDSEDGSEDDDDGEAFEEVKVDFQFFDPAEKDFHGLRALLHNFLDGEQYDASGLVDTIIKQVMVVAAQPP
jgi:hypothetical protein